MPGPVGAPVPTIAAYVRRGDKVLHEMKIVPFSDYIAAGELVMARLGVGPGQLKHMFLVGVVRIRVEKILRLIW